MAVLCASRVNPPWLVLVLLVVSQANWNEAFSKIPPKRVTAHQLVRYFLNPRPNVDVGPRHDKRQAQPFTYNVVYILDSSTSIKNDDFENAIKAMELLTTKARNDTKFAMILYAEKPRIVSDFTSQNGMLKTLSGIKRILGATNTHGALELCRTKFFGTPGTLNRVLLVTDGLSNINQDKMLFEAFQLKISNIEIFVVAVGRYQYGADEISALSSIPTTHVYRVESLRGLVRIVMWIPNEDE